MLVITRRVNQTVNIFPEDGQQIRVTVIEDRSAGQIRLGIEAPDGYAIERDELTRELRREAVALGLDPDEYCAEQRRETAARRAAPRENP